jgi:hypothetical protein
MKIIANTNGGYLIEADKRELALLMGFGNEYAEGFKTPTLGDVIDIKKIDGSANFLRTLDKEKIAKIRAQMERVLTEFDATAMAISEITIFEELKE